MGKKIISLILSILLGIQTIVFFPESVWAESRERQLTYYYALWMNLILDYGNLSIAATDFFGSAKDAADKLSKKAGELKDDAGKQAEKLKESAKDAAGKAGQKASEVKESAGEKSKELQGKASEVQKQLSEKAGEAINKGGEAGKAAKEAAESTLGSLRAYFENIDTEKFERGWDYVSRIASSTLSAAQSQEVGNRIRAVQERIQVLEQDINLSAANARQAAQEKGFVFEKWHADTLNIDAAAKGFSDRAWAVGSNEYGSVDVATSYGENASLKAYKTGKDSAFEQSRRANAQSKKLWEGFQKKNQELAAGGNAPISLGEYVDQYVPDSEMKDIFVAKYSGQTRIIPSDQMEEAVKYLEGKIDKLSQGSSKYDSAQQKVYEETLANLKDKLESPEGIASKPLSADELQAITEMAEEGKFDSEKRGIKVSSYITKSDILKNIITPAAEAAALQAALTVGPELVSIIIQAAKSGEIDEEQLKNVGISGVIAGTEGFVEGSVSSTIFLACKAGKLGKAFQDVSPDMVAMITVLAIDALRYGYQLANGEITLANYSDLMAGDVFTALAAQAAGIALASLLPMIPFAFLAGSMAGGMLAAAGFDSGKKVVMEVMDTGGLGAVLPEQLVDGYNVGKDFVAHMSIDSAKSFFKNAVVSTNIDGKITAMLSGTGQ